MKRFFAALLVLLITFSMSACTKTKEHQLVDANGAVKGYVRETLETMNEYCTKLEFMDANKNITHTMEATEEGLYYRWSIFDDAISRQTPLMNKRDFSLAGVVYIDVWNSAKKSMEGKEYYTFPCSGKIMEEYELKDNGKGEIFYTSAKCYNEDGSVKWSYTPKFGTYLIFGIMGGVDVAYVYVEELDDAGNEACHTYYNRETLAFEYAKREVYTDASTQAPTYIYWYNEDFSVRYSEENIFDSEGYINDTILYDANGNILDAIPE